MEIMRRARSHRPAHAAQDVDNQNLLIHIAHMLLGERKMMSFLNSPRKAFQFVGPVLVLVAAWLFYKYATDHTINDKLNGVIELFVGLVLIDRFGLVFTALELENKSEDYPKFAERLPALLAGAHDMVILEDRLEATKHYLRASDGDVREVKNTVIRYVDVAAGEQVMHRVSAEYDDAYEKWIKARERIITTQLCDWWEIISVNIPDSSEILHSVSKLKEWPKYRPKFINENSCPMMQMTIFRYRGNRKSLIMFGFSYVGHNSGATFMSYDDRLVAFFEKYFDKHYNDIAVGYIPPAAKSL